MSPLTGLNDLCWIHLIHGFAVGYMTPPASPAGCRVALSSADPRFWGPRLVHGAKKEPRAPKPGLGATRFAP
jgi:hypothetical protein